MKKYNDAVERKAIFLRKHGFSIPEISEQCKISRSTALRYVQKVKILPRYYARWYERKNAAKIISERDKKIASEYAKRTIRKIDNNILAIMGAALYWAEGSKKDLSFSNSDPQMIKIFLHIVRNVFKVTNDRIKISLRLYEDIDKVASLKFWKGITGMALGKSTSINILKGAKAGKLQYGMCRIRIKRGGLLLKNFFAIINQVNELI